MKDMARKKLLTTYVESVMSYNPEMAQNFQEAIDAAFGDLEEDGVEDLSEEEALSMESNGDTPSDSFDKMSDAERKEAIDELTQVQNSERTPLAVDTGKFRLILGATRNVLAEVLKFMHENPEAKIDPIAEALTPKTFVGAKIKVDQEGSDDLASELGDRISSLIECPKDYTCRTYISSREVTADEDSSFSPGDIAYSVNVKLEPVKK
jgi:hypothetical protein